MALEQKIVEISDELARKAEGGSLAYSAKPNAPVLTTTVDGITIYAFARAMGKLVKVEDEVTQISADRSTVTYVGKQFERVVINTLVFEATFGANGEVGAYNLGSIAVPEDINEKFPEKIDKKLTAGFQKIGLLV